MVFQKHPKAALYWHSGEKQDESESKNSNLMQVFLSGMLGWGTGKQN